MADQTITFSPNDIAQPNQPIQPPVRAEGNGPTVTFSSLDIDREATQKNQTQADKPIWNPGPNDIVAEIRTSDGRSHLIHGEDLAEAQRRDPNIKVVGQPKAYRDYARGRTLDNMTRAMSGQPMARPEDQAEAEKGKRAGTIAGGAAIATGALGGLLTPGVQVAQEASTILGPEGQPIIKEVVKDAPSAIGEIISALPKKATIEQALKIAQIAYKLGIGAGGAAYLWHELFGK